MGLTVEGFMRQAEMTAHEYMIYAVKRIDEEFGEGFARENPELIGKFMVTAATDFHTAIFNSWMVKIQERLDSGVPVICMPE